MSRYTIRNDEYEVIVGWDRGLQTFFYQVFDTYASVLEEEDVLVASSGDYPREIQEAREMKVPLEPYAELSEEWISRLENEKQASSGQLNPILQKIMEAEEKEGRRLKEKAIERFRQEARLKEYVDLLEHNWADLPRLCEWWASAPLDEVLSWCRQIRQEENLMKESL